MGKLARSVKLDRNLGLCHLLGLRLKKFDAVKKFNAVAKWRSHSRQECPTLLLRILFFFLFLPLAVFFEELFELGDLGTDYVPTVSFLWV